MEKEYFIFRRSFFNSIKDLPRMIQGEVLTAVMQYGITGVTTDDLKPITSRLFALIKELIDKDNLGTTSQKELPEQHKGYSTEKECPDFLQPFDNAPKNLENQTPNFIQKEKTKEKQEKEKSNKKEKEKKEKKKEKHRYENASENFLISTELNQEQQNGNSSVEAQTKEKEKKVAPKKEKESFLSEQHFPNDHWQSLWMQWLNYKAQRKKPYNTERGEIQAFSHLLNISDGDFIKAQKIVLKSIEREWIGLFKYKDLQDNEHNSSNNTTNERFIGRATAETIKRNIEGW